MAILTHPVQGEHALNFCTAKDETPMRLLVTHMSGKSQCFPARKLEGCSLAYQCDCAI